MPPWLVCFRILEGWLIVLLDKYTLDTKLYPNIVIVDGNWGAWTSHGSCSLTCGGGQQEWKRECDDPTPEHGGAECTGNDAKITTCKTCTCPRNNRILLTQIFFKLLVLTVYYLRFFNIFGFLQTGDHGVMVAVAVLRSGRQRLELVIQLLDVTVLVMVLHQIRILVINMVGNVSYWLKVGYQIYIHLNILILHLLL